MTYETLSCDDARAAGYFTVPSENVREAELKFAKLAKRARGRLRLSSSPVLVWKATGTYAAHFKIWADGEYRTVTKPAPCMFAAIEGEQPKIAGWSLAARLVRLATGERLVANVPDVEVPERFRTTGFECEHCNVSRLRNDVFVVKHDDGRFMQVGRTCLRDSLGHDPRALLAAFTAQSMIRESLDFDGFMFTRETYDTLSVMTLTAASIRVFGWVSRKTEQDSGYQATATTVKQAMSSPDPRLKKTDADADIAAKTLVWVREVLGGRNDLSDYESNLVAALRTSEFDLRAMGIACSAVSAYLRAVSREAELAANALANAASGHVGAIKERLRDVPMAVERCQLVESDFGSCHLIKMRDDAGNIYSWFTGTGHREVGQRAIVTGTVKAHKEYKGTKETQLSRCIVKEVK